MYHGFYFEIHKDHTGLHLISVEQDGAAQRLFVPRENILRYRLGEIRRQPLEEGMVPLTQKALALARGKKYRWPKCTGCG